MSRRDGPQFSSYLVKGPVFARFTLPDKVAGSVIGRQGQVLQEFEQSTGAQIKVSPSKVYFPSTNERTIIITGEGHQVKMGLPFLIHKLSEHGHDQRSLLLRMIIPNGSIPNIIGKGGEVVRSINSRTGATIHLCDKIEGIPETLLELKGADRSIIEAASEIIDIIQADPKLKDIAGEYYASFQTQRGGPPPQRQDWQDTYSRREDRRDNYPPRDEHRGEPSYSRRDDRNEPSYPRRDEWQEPSYHRHEDRSDSYQRREEAYSRRDEPSHSRREEPPYPRRDEPAYPRREEPGYPRREEPAYPRREEPLPPPRAPQYAAPPMSDPTTNPALLVYPMSIEFVVPVSSINYILGENGAHVEHVFNSTGAEVSISSEPDSIDANVRISGPLSGVQAAHILVIKQVADALMAESAA